MLARMKNFVIQSLLLLSQKPGVTSQKGSTFTRVNKSSQVIFYFHIYCFNFRYYLALAREGTERIVLNTMCSPKVKMLGNDAALVTYIRLVQSKLSGQSEQVHVNAYQESRVWQKKGGQWVNVHFHRSLANADSPVLES
eukprot:TRINITY_DN14587_c0_g1_i1.p2 TRINITY_DN14587_c0_g1~~TRINITY_DN14587_c0_g1_i1.p2  ORF type:complete len:139 (-),score=3.05 TRINITY_DN14587_c0_g1_i1:335-751(-)